MVLRFFRKKDPICGMKQEEGKGLLSGGNWFCSLKCKQEFVKAQKKQNKKRGSCCN